MSAWQHVSTSAFTRWKSRPFLGLLTSPPPSWQRPMAKVAPAGHKKTKRFYRFSLLECQQKTKVLWRETLKRYVWTSLYSIIRYVFLFLSDPQIQSATSATWTSSLPFWGPHALGPDSQPLPAHTMTVNSVNGKKKTWRRDDLDAQLYSWAFFQPNVKPTPWALWCSFCWHLSSQPLEICYFHR